MFNFGKTYKYLEKVNHGFWNIINILTYGRQAMIVTGSRSVGKSTQVALLCLFTYALYGKKFVYSRRRQKDIEKTYKTFFNNAVEIFNSVFERKIIAFKPFNGRYWIAFTMDENEEPLWEECGCYIPLADEENYKSNSFSEYVILIYDEFISKDPNKYLGCKDNTDAEWSAVISLAQTIDRGIDTPFRNELALFCLGNKSTVYNPIALSIGLVDYVQKGARFTAPKGKQWIWENIDHVEATSDYKESSWYQLASDQDKNYAYENEGADPTDFIKRPNNCLYIYTVQIKGEKYGIYTDHTNYYLDIPKSGYLVKSLDIHSHGASDSGLIRSWRQDSLMMQLTEAYCDGRLFFGNGKIQSIFLKYLEFTK